MTGQRRNQGLTAGRRQGGMTLIEMLVSTAILAMMVLLVNMLLVSSRRTIMTAQATIRSNASARALIDVLRRNLMAANKNGFMAIMRTPLPPPYRPRDYLIFTTAGNYHSMCEGTGWANAARVEVGLAWPAHYVDANDTPDDPDDDVRYYILYRQAVLHDPTITVAGGVTPFEDGKDYHRLAMTDYQYDPDCPVDGLAPWLYRDLYATYDFALAPGGAATFPVMVCLNRPEFSFPVTKLDDLNTLWPYVLKNVSEFKVQWTDGRRCKDPDADCKIPWYDAENPHNSQWPSVGPDDPNLPSHPDFPECNLTGGGRTPQRYCAFWSFWNKDHWPKALRLQFKIGKPPRPYEVVIDLPD
jgi:prepilin-type N-terminal cleavage/methylation domain-containing protein